MGELHYKEIRQTTVSISPHAEGLRLRWRVGKKRPELYIPASQVNCDKIAQKIKAVIEYDLLTGSYDESLRRYKGLMKLAAHTERLESELNRPIQPVSVLPYQKPLSLTPKLDILKEFDRYIAAKSLNPDSEDLSSYYTQTRAMLKKWGDFDPEQTPVLLSKEAIGPKTFNDRRNCLVKFFGWLVRKGKLPDNPLQEVSTKRRQRNTEQRKPFTDMEVALILDALKTDRYKKKSARYSHHQYYPLVAFMIQTGVRNAEAIGLQVRDVLWDRGEIKICRALARTRKGTNEAARKEKGTKTNNVRYLPMNEFLIDLLKPQCLGKKGTDLVFTNEAGRMIDDRMFQRRVFKPLLEELKLQDRDLYACRHTFATRAVQAGMKAHEVAYLMGDNLQTVVANYYHSERVTTSLPNLTSSIMDMKKTE